MVGMEHAASHPFVRAIELVGSSNLARELGISPQAVSKMRRSAEADPTYLVPSNHLRPIERATRGEVTIDDLLAVAADERKRGACESNQGAV